MRFLGKYELLEQLTVGKVETFAAYPIGGGERLLVHVFALPALIKSAPTNRDLLGYMEEISPPAMGTLLDAGRYDDGSQAYIVTKFPRDRAALGIWVEAYKASVKSKHDTTAEVVPAELWEEGRSSETQEISVPKKPENPPGEFTRAFQSAGAPNLPDKSPPPPVARPEPPIAPDSLPTGEFFVPRPVRSPAPVSLTDQFMAGLGEGSRLGGTPERSTPAAKPEPIENTAPFRMDSPDPWKESSVTQSAEPLPVDSSRPGEFTMFFKGPLAPPSASSETYPADEPYSRAPSRPSAGEFTRTFGAAAPSAGSPLPSEPLLEPAAQGDGFTDVFGKATVPLPEPPPAKAAPEPPASLDPAPGYVVSQNTNFPPAPLPQAAPEPMFGGSSSLGASPLPGQSRDDNATRLFRTPVQDAQGPAPEPAPPRESEYTRIISAKPQPAGAEKSPKPAAAGAGPAIQVSVPISPPPMPSLQPSGPHLAMPAPTPMQFPSVPTPQVPSLEIKVPPPAKGAGKKKTSWTSYVPLIVILNLLLLAAVGLILYFIFAH